MTCRAFCASVRQSELMTVSVLNRKCGLVCVCRTLISASFRRLERYSRLPMVSCEEKSRRHETYDELSDPVHFFTS